MKRGVLAIRIYFDVANAVLVPMADLKMSDGSIEHICWVNAEQRKQYIDGIDGYALIYDERPKRDWIDWT